eukprot:COSAG02_NODE_48478_length_333_cov_1.055556_1_plen_30_part_01
MRTAPGSVGGGGVVTTSYCRVPPRQRLAGA